MVQHLDFLVLAVSCRSEVQWWMKLLAFPWQSRGSLVVTQGSLPSWISKCMSNLQSLPYLQWTLKDAPWRLWRVSHPILSLIGLSLGEDQKLPTSLLRKGCKFCCYKHGITSLIVQQLSFQRWDKWHFLELCHKGQPEVWRICSGPISFNSFQAWEWASQDTRRYTLSISWNEHQ